MLESIPKVQIKTQMKTQNKYQPRPWTSSYLFHCSTVCYQLIVRSPFFQKKNNNFVLPVDEGGSCWPGQVQEGGGSCCGSGKPALFFSGISHIFRYFPYSNHFFRYITYIEVAYLVGSLPQLLVCEEKAGRVAHHPLLLAPKPVVVSLPRIVWVHYASSQPRSPLRSRS